MARPCSFPPPPALGVRNSDASAAADALSRPDFAGLLQIVSPEAYDEARLRKAQEVDLDGPAGPARPAGRGSAVLSHRTARFLLERPRTALREGMDKMDVVDYLPIRAGGRHDREQEGNLHR